MCGGTEMYTASQKNAFLYVPSALLSEQGISGVKQASQRLDGSVDLWSAADSYICSRFRRMGYAVLLRRVLSDCIGYRLERKGVSYAVYAFLCATEGAWPDEAFVRKLKDKCFSDSSVIISVFLHLKQDPEQTGTFTVTGIPFTGSGAPELLKLTDADGRPILEAFTDSELMLAEQRFCYAFNSDDLDAYECLVALRDPAFYDGIDQKGFWLNSAFYNNMIELHRKYGEMKASYISFDDVVYYYALYLEGYGYFKTFFDLSGRISKLVSCPFESDDYKIADLIRIDKSETNGWFSSIPKLISVTPLLPEANVRFALKMEFGNGETRRYILPIERDKTSDEVVNYIGWVFTDRIWQTAQILDKRPSELRGEKVAGFRDRGTAVTFSNGCCISAASAYVWSSVYLSSNH